MGLSLGEVGWGGRGSTVLWFQFGVKENKMKVMSELRLKRGQCFIQSHSRTSFHSVSKFHCYVCDLHEPHLHLGFSCISVIVLVLAAVVVPFFFSLFLSFLSFITGTNGGLCNQRCSLADWQSEVAKTFTTDKTF